MGYGVYLYDMDIKDVAERFAKRQVFPKAVQAANFLGMRPCQLYDIIAGKAKYARHRETRKQYAVRKISESNNTQKPITLKNQ
jgi:hypothetical protein